MFISTYGFELATSWGHTQYSRFHKAIDFERGIEVFQIGNIMGIDMPFAGKDNPAVVGMRRDRRGCARLTPELHPWTALRALQPPMNNTMYTFTMEFIVSFGNRLMGM